MSLFQGLSTSGCGFLETHGGAFGRLPAEIIVKAKQKILPYRSRDEATMASFRDDPEFAAAYLNAILQDGDQQELLLALRRMAWLSTGTVISTSAK